MKRRIFLSTIAALGLSTVGLFARGKRAGSGRGMQNITQEQKDTILFIYQEEKVARDVYTYFAGLYPEEFIFSQIAKSEQWHMNSAEGLCNSYGIDTTGINEEEYGTFVIQELQDLYDSMIAQGEESLLKALYVGETIEILDINDLEEAMDSMPNLRNVKQVYGNLLRGSNNHLAAFRSAITRVE